MFDMSFISDSDILNKIVEIYPDCQKDESHSSSDEIVLRLFLKKEDVLKFKSDLCKITNTEWIVYHVVRNPQKFVFKKEWICQHSKRHKKDKSKRNASCSAKLKIKIKKINKLACYRDKYLRLKPPLQAEIKLNLLHTHTLFTEDVLGMLRVTDEVKEIYNDYFSSGLSPADAMRCHKFLLDENSTNLADASINPTPSQVYHLHNCWRQKNYGSNISPIKKLKVKIPHNESKGNKSLPPSFSLELNDPANSPMFVDNPEDQLLPTVSSETFSADQTIFVKEEDKKKLMTEFERIFELVKMNNVTKKTFDRVILNLKNIKSIEDLDLILLSSKKIGTSKRVRVQPTLISKRPGLVRINKRVSSGPPALELKNEAIIVKI